MINLIRTNKIGLFLIIILILTYWINIKLILILRPVDILLFFAFIILFLFNKIEKGSIGLLTYSIIFAILSSSIFGLIFVDDSTVAIEGVGLLFKYAELVVLFLFLKNISLERDEAVRLIILSIIIFIGIVCFVYARTILYTTGRINIRGGLRPDFPFSIYNFGEQGAITNAGHLMGSYLATGSIAIIIYLLERKSNVFLILISISFLFGSIILTGSRSSVVAIIASLFIYFFTCFFMKLWIEKHNLKMAFMLVLVILITVGVILSLSSELARIEKLVKVLQRGFSFELSSDTSFSSRLEKTQFGIENLAETGFLIGAGVFAYQGWLDNGILRVMHDVGLVMFLIMVFAFIKFITGLYYEDKTVSTVLFYMILTFFVTNIFAEFFLVPRGAFPVFIAIFLLLQLRDSNNKHVYSPSK